MFQDNKPLQTNKQHSQLPSTFAKCPLSGTSLFQTPYIEDYFCFDSDGGEDESDDHGKCIHNRMNSIMYNNEL